MPANGSTGLETLREIVEDFDARPADGAEGAGGHVVEVTVIRAGTSSNGNHYAAELLRDAAPLFDGARAFADHTGPVDRRERSVRDLVGYYRRPRFDPGPGGGRLRADFHLLPGHDWLWGIIRESQRQPAICGLSIDALGEATNAEVAGRKVRLVQAIRKVNSIDVVTRPAAGGSLDRIVAGEAAGDGALESDEVSGAAGSEERIATGAHAVGSPLPNGAMEEAGALDRAVPPAGDLCSDSNSPKTHHTNTKDHQSSQEQGPDAVRAWARNDVIAVSPGSGLVEQAEVAEAGATGMADDEPHPPDGIRLTADERRRFATVIRHHPDGTTDYRFPIPPAGHRGAHGHAVAALARLDQSDLSPEEKASVRRQAERVLGRTGGHTASSRQQSMEGSDMSTTPSAGAADTPVPAGATHLREDEPPADIAEQLQRVLAERDAAARELSHVKEALSPSPATPSDPGASAVQLLEQIKRERDLEKSQRLLENGLRASGLPEPIQARLRRRYGGRVFGEAQLQEDIGDEREVLAGLSASGRVSGNGFEKPFDGRMGLSEYEQLQAAFDKLFDVCESEEARAVPALGGIRQAFRTATGVDISGIGGVDRPLQEVYASGLRGYVQARMAAGRLTEAEYLLREADVTTSTFSYLLGTSMNKRLLKDYQAWPSEWQKFSNLVAIKDFKQQDRIRLGAFGSLSTVNEDAAYTTLTLADTHATYTPTKRGNLVQISRETIINDDLYAIKQIPQKLAVSAAFTLAEFVYQLLDPAGGNIYDAHKLFDATNHANTAISSGNIGTANSGTAFSSAALQTAVVAMRKQQNAASKPIGLKPRFVLVPPDLEFTAMVILKSAGLPGGANNDINPMMGYAEPIVAPQLNSFTNLGATTTFAAAVADPRVIDTVEIGFVGGQVNPVLFIQDQPLYGINFTQDVISYKVRHEYGGAVVDYRGFYLINN